MIGLETQEMSLDSNGMRQKVVSMKNRLDKTKPITAALCELADRLFKRNIRKGKRGNQEAFPHQSPSLNPDIGLHGNASYPY